MHAKFCTIFSFFSCVVISSVLSTSDLIADFNSTWMFFEKYTVSDRHFVGKDTKRETSLSTEKAQKFYRLSFDVKPRDYDIFIHPNLEDGSFNGKVSIIIDVWRPRSNIILNERNLSITSARINSLKNVDKIIVPKIFIIEKSELVILHMEKGFLTRGMYNLTMEFAGSLKNKVMGLYLSRYTTELNQTSFLATTQFEPTSAREAFPCFDEPNLKAYFTVHLIFATKKNYKALSNMNVQSEVENQPSPGLTTVTFAKSVPMSTYLVAFVVCDYDFVTANAQNLHGKLLPVNVYMPKDLKSQGNYALEIGVEIVEYFMKLFSMDYALPKLDMIAISDSDFAAGAMENWGLVTYKQSLLLYDPKKSTTSQKKFIANTVAHELAHMYFGNLVTLKWWNDIWLNEGFATYMSIKAIDAIRPDSSSMSDFLLQKLLHSMAWDAKLNTSRPLIKQANSPNEIANMFDVAITYLKGASVIQMLEHFMGKRNFEIGIRKYLKEFSYKNVESSDLFGVFQEILGSKINVSDFMGTWTRQMGFPVISVEKSEHAYKLTQKRFLIESNVTYDPEESIYGYKWTIPVTYITSKNSTPTHVLFNRNESELSIAFNEPVEWIKFNVDGIGYYYVNYEVSDWLAISKLLNANHTKLTVANRAGLLNEAFSLATASLLNYGIVINLTTYLKSERDYIPWTVLRSKIPMLMDKASSSNMTQKIKELVRSIVNNIYHDLKWEITGAENMSTLSLRPVIFDVACSVGHIKCLKDVGVLWKHWFNDFKNNRPHVDIFNLVLHYGMFNASETEWSIVFNEYKNEKNPDEKNNLMISLTRINNSKILRRYLEIVIEDQSLIELRASFCIFYILKNPAGIQIVVDWIESSLNSSTTQSTRVNGILKILISRIDESTVSTLKLQQWNAHFS